MGPGQIFVDQVGSAIFGLNLGFGNFPLKIPNFSIFCPLGQKNLIGYGQKLPGSKPGPALNYCSGQGPSLVHE